MTLSVGALRRNEHRACNTCHEWFRNGYANIERVARGDPPLWVIPEMRDLFPTETATD